MHPIRSHRFAIAAVWVVLAVSLSSHRAHAAPIVAVSQTRTVTASASASIPGQSDSDSATAAAPDFGAFNGSIAPGAIAQSAASGQTAGSTGAATQTSSLGSGSVSADGTVQAKLGLTAGANASAAADASSVFEFVFDITAASTYTLTGSLNTQAILSGGADLPSLLNDFAFENITTSTTLFQALTNDEAFSLSGLLNPGRYRLSASATADASQASILANARNVDATSSYSFILDVGSSQVPEPESLLLALTALTMMGAGRKPMRVPAIAHRHGR